MMRSLSLSLSFVLLTVISFASGDKWDNIEKNLKGGSKDFHSVVDPLAFMTLLSYTTTKGFNNQEDFENLEVHGFSLDEGLSTDPDVGVRAKVYLGEKVTDPVVIAFRGSDISLASEGSLADACFDVILLRSEFEHIKLPSFCNETAPELNYYSQAEKIVLQTTEKYQDRRIVLTGHSTGCGLAGMMSVRFKERVTGVGFSCPGILKYTASKTETPISGSKNIDNFYTLAATQDPIVLVAAISESSIGKKFLWSSPALKSCSNCCKEIKNGTEINVFTDRSCIDCFKETHDYRSVYQRLIIPRGSKAVFVEDDSSITKCDKRSKFPQLDRVQMGMSFLLILVILMTLVGVASATIAYRSKQASFSKYLEIGNQR